MARESTVTAFENVSVIAMEADAPLPDQTVLVDGDRIRRATSSRVVDPAERLSR